MAELVLRLFVAGDDARSRRAIACARSVSDRMPGRVELSIVDVLTDPASAEADGIIASPTLLRAYPEPPLRIVGDLSVESKVYEALGIEAPSEPASSTTRKEEP